MNIKKNMLILICLLIISIFAFSVFASAEEVELKAAAGQVGGGWYTIVSGLAEIINSNLKGTVSIIVVPGSGVSNIANCSKGEAPITMSFPPFIIAGRKGVDPYDQKYPNTLVIASQFGYSAQHFVTTNMGINSYGQIASEKIPIKITLNRPGATDEFIWRKVMNFYNFNYDDVKKWGGKVFFVGHGESVQLIKDGHADSHYSYISVPGASIIEMAISKKLKFLSVPEDLINYLVKEWSLFRVTIPKETYKLQDKDILSLGMANTLMVNANISEDLVYKITKVLAENVDSVRAIHKTCEKWSPEIAAKGVKDLLHPGAYKYYKEMGYIE